MGIINVKNLKKAYGQVRAVNGVSFQIEKGKVFGMLGPNGAGKTSIINMMIGLSRPSSGSIVVNGIDALKNTKEIQGIIGVIPDENNLYNEMSGFDNLCFCASLYGIRKREREKRAAELLTQFGLDTRGGRLFKTYSKGMKRRLTIAAGIIHNPKILFLDEPTTGIDVESARQVRELIINLKNQGKTIFITTHYIEDAKRICDEIAFIANGKIIKTGTATELMESVKEEYKIKMLLNKSMVEEVEDELTKRFKIYKIENIDKETCLIISKERLPLYPIIQFFNNKGISVYEAKEIKPTLEDAFVRITGIAATKLQKEKEKIKK